MATMPAPTMEILHIMVDRPTIGISVLLHNQATSHSAAG
jgi:hypothetical protein